MATLKSNSLSFTDGSIAFPVKVIASDQDANTILTSGIFRGTFTNAPNSDLGWILSINMASESDTRYTAQFFGTYNSDGVYFRHRSEGYWGAWKLIQMSAIS